MKLDILIPCHNDCTTATQLLESLNHQTRIPNHAEIVHNGCENGSLPFSNKARAINHASQHSDADYIISLDADVRLSPFFVEAIQRAIEQKGLEAGSGIVLKEQPDMTYRGNTQYIYNGAAFFVKCDLLASKPIPEDCVVEDTDYMLLLRKAKHKIGTVADAIAYEQERPTSCWRIIKRQIRYHQGALQLLRKNRAWRYGVQSLFVFAASVFIFALLGWLAIFAVNMWPASLALAGLLFAGCAVLYWQEYGRKGLVVGALGAFVPIVAVSLCILRKRIW